MDQGRGGQVIRLLTIIQILATHRYGKTVTQLSEELGENPRTLYRDLKVLEEVGLPIYDDTREGSSYWSFTPEYRKKYRDNLPNAFNITELISLYLSRDLLMSLEGTVFFDSIEALIKKIRSQLGEKLVEFLESTEQAFAAGMGPASDYAQRKEVLHSLNEACLRCRVIKFRYHSRKNELTERRVHPHKVYYYQGILYLIAYDPMREDFRIFVLDRMEDLVLSEESFKRREDFALDDYLKHSFGVMRDAVVNARVWIDAREARFVAEKIWHESQKIKNNADGSIEISFQVAGFIELKQWVLALGPAAQVLDPPELVEEIRHDLEAALKNYAALL